MILYRLTKTKYLAEAWTGYGAKLAGGRWNSSGTAMCYVSETASLTILETLVHIDSVQLIDTYTLLSIDVPEDLLLQAKMSALPEYWNAEKAPAELALYGDAWIRSGQSVGLRVPSALSPVEFNYLLNPEHPDFPAIVNRAVSIPFKFDTRLKL